MSHVVRSLVIASAMLISAPACAKSAAAPAADVAGFAGNVKGGTREGKFYDIQSLRMCLMSPGAICVPDRSMTLQPGIQRLKVAREVTLDGKGLLALKCDTYCLDLREGDNIIRGVRFAGPGPQRTLWPDRFPDANCTNPTAPKNLSGCAVPINLNGAKHVLVERNNFTTCGNKCIAIDDGDAVTIRRNRFSNSYFGILAVAHRPDGPIGKMTITGNVFDTVFRRSARVAGRMAMHEFGNVFTGLCPRLPGGGFGISAASGAEALVEDNIADAGSCSLMEESGSQGEVTGRVEGKGRILSRNNSGLPERRETAGLTIPYAYPRAAPTGARKADIIRNAGVTPQ